MSDSQYAEFAEAHVVEYARQLTLAGEVAQADSLNESRGGLGELLADQLRGTGHWFFTVACQSVPSPLSWLWVAPPPSFLPETKLRVAWLCQITVELSRRGKGLGRASLLLLQAELKEQGVGEVWLRVFNWNTAARGLYESLGYQLVKQFPSDSHWKKIL